METTLEIGKIMCALALVLGEYALVLLSVLADLVSGVRKAKKRGEATRSKALRRTVDKLARYYNVLFALTVIDAMQIGGVEYLRMTAGLDVPMVPVMTLLGAIGLAVIEIKSIYEKAEEKERNEYDEAMRIVLKYVKKVRDESRADGE